MGLAGAAIQIGGVQRQHPHAEEGQAGQHDQLPTHAQTPAGLGRHARQQADPGGHAQRAHQHEGDQIEAQRMRHALRTQQRHRVAGLQIARQRGAETGERQHEERRGDQAR